MKKNLPCSLLFFSRGVITHPKQLLLTISLGLLFIFSSVNEALAQKNQQESKTPTGSANSNVNGTLAPLCALPTITANPQNKIICSGENTSFSMTDNAPAAPSYQWQISTNGGGTWTNLTNTAPFANVNTKILLVNGANTTYSGNVFRCIVSNACGAATTTAATLTVNPLPVVNAGPGGLCAPVVLTATGTANSFAWSPATGLNTTTGATVTASPTINTVYTVTGTITATGCANTANVTVSGTPPTPVITPSAPSICEGTVQSLSVQGSLPPNTATWTPVTGLFTNAAGTTPYVAGTAVNTVYASPATTNTYTVTNINGTCNSAPATVAVTVLLPVTITTQPVSQSVCQGANATFSVVTAGNFQTYQWQLSTNGGTTWTNITGATSASLVLPAVATTLNGYQYRVIAGNSCFTVTSAAVTLTVNAIPVLSIGTIPARICLSDTIISLVGVGIPVGGNWSGIGISGFNFVPTATAPGTYTLTYTYASTAGCTSTASIVAKVEDCPERIRLLKNNAVLLYPNPNNGQFNIRINSDLYNTLNMKVFTRGGQLLRNQEFGGLVFGRVINIDLTNLPSGTYMVKFYYNDWTKNTDKSFKVIIGRR